MLSPQMIGQSNDDEKVRGPQPLRATAPSDVTQLVKLPELKLPSIELELPSELTLNFVVLGGILLTVAYVFLSVDMEIARGWTWGEFFLRLPSDNWYAYESNLHDDPLGTKALLNTGIYVTGDYIAQCITVGGGSPTLKYDLGRLAKNALLGFVLAFFAHEYYEIGEMMLPMSEGNAGTALLKVAIDQTFYAVTWNALYVGGLGLLSRDSWDVVQARVSAKAWPLLKAGWRLWPFAHIITYGLIPVRHRILWVGLVDLVWCTILSSTSSEAEAEGATRVARELAGAVHGAAEQAPGPGSRTPRRSFRDRAHSRGQPACLV